MNPIQMAAKLYDARDAAKTIFGKQYATALVVALRSVHEKTARERISETSAAIALANAAETTGTRLLFLATIVESTESSAAPEVNA
jgi:hypothetical protein